MQHAHTIIAILALITFILSIVLVAHKKENFAYEHLCKLQSKMILDSPFIGNQANAEEAYQNCMNWPGYMPSASVYQKY